MDLEKQIKQIREEMESNALQAIGNIPQFGSKGVLLGDGLPREPAKFTMTGHRQKVTKIIVHPFYNIVASSSEDASIRLWDFE